MSGEDRKEKGQGLRVDRSEGAAAGPRAALGSLQLARSALGTARSLQVLGRLNQRGGFDCPGCAWPDPSDRSFAEFCENGVKHAVHEATPKRVDARFFERFGLGELRAKSHRWLEEQGRIAEPLFKPADEDRYRPIAWSEAVEKIADALRALPSPDEAIFYTSGRTSNEAAFLYQLLAREYGTNNLPDCSNMCHESSGTGLGEVIGVGKGTVSLEDFDHADLILVIGQNPGSNHPRMLATLQAARRRGCRIVSINPLRERGLVRFAHPKEALGLVGRGEAIAHEFVQLRVGGDVALFQGLSKAVLEAADEDPSLLARAFIEDRTTGFDDLRERLAATPWPEIERASGVDERTIRALAELYARSKNVIACWAMGITQHEHGVDNVREIVNLLLLRANIGRAGAGVCPVRGHSNVQGDRTMGIWEKPKPAFLDALEREFSFEAPREHGTDTVAALERMLDGRAQVFVAMGGNFVVATPDTLRAEQALERCALTVQISTTLNRSHLVTGQEALILPCLSRSERDVQPGGPQFVTVENSMSVVHRSEGQLPPAADALQSEPRIVASIAEALLGDRSQTPWRALADDYNRIRDRIGRVVPGFHDFNERVRQKDGFVLPSGARTADFDTPDGRAHFSVHAIPDLELPDGQLRMMTLRSHDQFNTTVYSDDDRYRGILGSRRVVLLCEEDLHERGLAEGDLVDVTSHFAGETRQVESFQVVAYDIPRGSAGMYFPEANPLVPLESMARGSRTPAYKSVPITLAPS